MASLGSFLAQLDATTANVALPSLVVDLNSSIAVVQWVVTGYLLALILVLPLSGHLVGRIGARAVYLVCFAGFALTSTLCGLAWSASSLVAFRVLQGLSGGLLAPMAQMMIARVAGNQMARVAGYAAIPILLGPILGPILASGLLHYLSWRWLFFATALIAAGAIVLALAFVPPDCEEDMRRQPMDWVGLILLSPGLALLLYSLDHAHNAMGLALLGAALIMLISFVAVARAKGSRALIDIHLFAHPPFRAAAISQFLTNGINFAGQMLLPMFLILGCGLPPGEIGWLMAPLGAGMMCAYPSVGRVIERFGIRSSAATGAVLSLTAMLLLAGTASLGLTPLLLMPSLFLLGVGQGAVGLSSMTAAYTMIAKSDLPMATTSLNICQRLGGPVLTTLSAFFLERQLATKGPGPTPLGAFSSSFLLLGSVLVLCAFVTLLLPKAATSEPTALFDRTD